MYILLYLNYDQMPAMLQAHSVAELNEKLKKEFPDFIAEGLEFDEVSDTMTLFQLDPLTREFQPAHFELIWQPAIAI